MYQIKKPRNRAFLVILQTTQREKDFLEESYREMKELAGSALVQTVGSILARVSHPSPSHFIRQGKLEEVIFEAKKAGANCLLFNVDLSPVQARNVEKEAKISVLDRTGLILDIFGRRAKSKEGQLQVEHARLSYMLPRIGGLGGVMSRLGGGVGTRGPGEQELEHDRRKIRGRMERIKDELKKVRKHRELLRSGRKRRNFLSVALVGYTNAGKSTLLNALTGADTYVEDKMFATLDPKTRVQNLAGRRDVLFIDTVGFLRDLPHGLVESFHATLEEVTEADLLIHVLDISQAKVAELYMAVQKVLQEIGSLEKPTILVLNKADLLDELARSLIQRQWPQGVLVSAKEGLGMKQLLTRIDQILPPRRTEGYFSQGSVSQ